MDFKILDLFIAIVIVSLVYHLLGSLFAWIKDKASFSWELFWKGILQGAGGCVGAVALYFAGVLTPNIIIATVDGDPMTLIQILTIAMLAIFAFHAVKLVKMVTEMLGLEVANTKTLNKLDSEYSVSEDAIHSIEEVETPSEGGEG